jgi:hypothetical protein
MKLGVSYNVFYDSIELLEGSINRIRPYVDYINVMFQQVSNHNLKAEIDIVPHLNYLKNCGKINDYFEYMKRSNMAPTPSEMDKRMAGIKHCEDVGCTHVMTMDSDEYYLPEQFSNAKEFIDSNNIKSSMCQLQTYWKTKNYRLKIPEAYYVPFIYRFEKGCVLKVGQLLIPGHAIDPTRGMFYTGNKSGCHIFTRDKLQMHHLSFVRNNFRAKIMNSSARANYEKQIPGLIDYHTYWAWPMPAKTCGNNFPELVETNALD